MNDRAACSSLVVNAPQVGDPATADFSSKEYSGALIQYPNTFGDVINPEEFVKKAHEVSAQKGAPGRACGRACFFFSFLKVFS